MQTSANTKSGKSWSVVAPFFGPAGSGRWIDDFVTGHAWNFQKVPLTTASDDWHARPRRATGAGKWLDYWSQAGRAFPASGVITIFPQLALMASMQKMLRRSDAPLLAWCFNLGQHPHGLKRAAARMALKGVDRFVVHSTGEIAIIAEFLDIPPEKVEFVPLQRAPIPIEETEDTDVPFVVAMGSANRDYRTFLKAAEISALPCKLVASPRLLKGLRIPDNVSVEHGLTASECHRIVQRSRFSVVPLDNPAIASGQVTVIESMRMNRPVVATESIGTVDYIANRATGALVPRGDPQALATAMTELWDDGALRKIYADNAAAFAEERLSDPAAAQALARIISTLESQRGFARSG